jgi:hypothetical protein
MRTLAALAVGTLALAALRPGVALAFDFFVAHEPVYALVGEELFVGEARARIDRSGKLAVRSTLEGSMHCEGTFRFTHSDAGEVSLQCSDGTKVELNFDAIGIASGHGRGLTPRGPVRFAFGLSPEKASPYLELPKGKRLVRTAAGLRIQEG